MSKLEVVGHTVVFCPLFRADACAVIDGVTGCPHGRNHDCNLVSSRDSYASTCAAVVYLVTQYIAHEGWSDDAIAEIINAVSCMDGWIIIKPISLVDFLRLTACRGQNGFLRTLKQKKHKIFNNF